MDQCDHAVILAAGLGRRLQPLTDDRPKTLLEVGEKPILGHIFDALAENGYDYVTMVVGFEAEQIREYCQSFSEFSFTFVHNEDYASTNNLYSLWLARNRLGDGFTLINADTVFPPTVLQRLTEANGSALVVDKEKDLGSEEMAVDIDGGELVDIGKELAGDGEYIGVAKFDSEDASRLVEYLDAFIEDGRTGEWYEHAFQSLFEDVEIGYVDVTGEWIEIDDADDLKEGRENWQSILHGENRT